jgi:hypothetical protein
VGVRDGGWGRGGEGAGVEGAARHIPSTSWRCRQRGQVRLTAAAAAAAVPPPPPPPLPPTPTCTKAARSSAAAAADSPPRPANALASTAASSAGAGGDSSWPSAETAAASSETCRQGGRRGASVSPPCNAQSHSPTTPQPHNPPKALPRAECALEQGWVKALERPAAQLLPPPHPTPHPAHLQVPRRPQDPLRQGGGQGRRRAVMQRGASAQHAQRARRVCRAQRRRCGRNNARHRPLRQQQVAGRGQGGGGGQRDGQVVGRRLLHPGRKLLRGVHEGGGEIEGGLGLGLVAEARSWRSASAAGPPVLPGQGRPGPQRPRRTASSAAA